MAATRTTTDQGYRGKRYIAYARCAAEDGAASKLQEQVRLIREFGDSLDMQCVDEVQLAGVSGGPPALRDDLRRLLTRKREQDDFEVLIMEDFARLTRTGLAGRMDIETEFANCGVQIVYLTEAMMTDETAGETGVHDTLSDDRRNATWT